MAKDKSGNLSSRIRSLGSNRQQSRQQSGLSKNTWGQQIGGRGRGGQRFIPNASYSIPGRRSSSLSPTIPSSFGPTIPDSIRSSKVQYNLIPNRPTIPFPSVALDLGRKNDRPGIRSLAAKVHFDRPHFLDAHVNTFIMFA